MIKIFVFCIILISALSAYPLLSNSVYATDVGGGDGDLNQTGNETTPPINQTIPTLSTNQSFNLTNTNPEDPYSTLTTCDGRFRFYRRNVNDKLVEFSDNEGYNISFAPQQQLQYFHQDNKRFMATYQNFTTIYETISNTKVKNTIVFYSQPDSNVINETISFDKENLEYYIQDGEIYFRQKSLPNQIIDYAPKFKIEKPFAIDSNGTHGYCHYEIMGDNLKLIIDQNFLDNPRTLFPIYIDPTWIDNTTSDWDMGTKSGPNDEVYDIETSTDNPGINIDNLELKSYKGDGMKVDSADLLTWRWGKSQTEGTDAGTHDHYISSDELILYSKKESGIDAKSNCAIKVYLSNDFDVQLDLDLSHSSTHNTYGYLFAEIDNNNKILISKQDDLVDEVIRAKSWVSGAGAENTYSTTDDTVSLRLTRVSDTVKAYYSLDQDDVWTELHSRSSFSQSDIEIFLMTTASQNNGAEITFKATRFKFNTVTFASNGYGTIGNWTSQNLTLSSGAVINNWTVNLTNGDTNHHVNISFLQGGSEKARYDNITSNITITESMLTNGTWDNITAGNFTYKLEFVGNGSSSPVVHSSHGFQNYLPTANAGSIQSVDNGTTVTFDGSGSSDPDGNITNWTWTFTYNGSPQTLYNETADFTFSITGTYVVTLTVTDDGNQTDTDTMTVTVTDPTPPADDDAVTTTLSEIGPALLMIIILMVILWLFAKLKEYQQNKPRW